ncbi:DUF4429 domain-containing protein [Nocardiopsis valliformis]|uniref:DUF4429 domain-containing protein n=1 Tax=Nocardiopsis valliformis TaxID=239974 RepID=UPI0003468376|nr:DUF4429 domain-containing protein [Nocardiopsis valliformis]
MDELRGDQAAWVFDGESISIRYETKGWFKSPLLKLLGSVELPVSAVQGVDFLPGAGRKKGWVMNLRMHDRMDPYAAVGAMLDEKSEPFRLTGPAKTELVAEYLADQITFAASQAGPPDPATPTRLVPALPLHIRTCEGTARLEAGRLTLVWGGSYASSYKKKKQRREYDLAEITGVEWMPLDDWGWGFVRFITRKNAEGTSAKPKNDLNLLRAGEEGNEIHQVLLLAAAVTAHRWTLGGATRPVLESGADDTEEAPPGFDDPEWWKEAARNTMEVMRGPRLTLNLPGLGRAKVGEDDPKGPAGAQRPPEVEPAPAPAPDAAPAGADTTWIFEQIERLGDLHAKGLLTDEEFSAKKAELLDRI